MQNYRFICFVTRRFIEDDCTYRASALAFTTLLAIVPLMSVGLAILSSLPVIQDLKDPLQNFIFENFVPATGKVIQGYLQQFTAQVSRMSLTGVVFLFVTAILVMVTIESSLNKIWRVSAPRKGIPAFLLYWAILSLAPILLGLSIAASSWLLSIPFIKNHHPGFLLSGIPFTLSFIAFVFLYIVVPNCYVALKHAVWGGLIAAIAFEVAKAGFAWHLSRFNTYELLYGAFAMVPIFFVWIYWVWVIILIGAEITYALSVHYERRTGQAIDGLSHALLWLEALWQAQKRGQGLTMGQLINLTRQPYATDINTMTNLLLTEKLIHHDQKGHLLLSKALNQISLADLVRMLPFPIPHAEALNTTKRNYLAQWETLMAKHNQCVNELMACTLEKLFEKDGRR